MTGKGEIQTSYRLGGKRLKLTKLNLTRETKPCREREIRGGRIKIMRSGIECSVLENHGSVTPIHKDDHGKGENKTSRFTMQGQGWLYLPLIT